MNYTTISLLPTGYIHNKTSLFDEPVVRSAPRSLRILKIEVKITNNLRNDLRHLHQADVLAHTRSGAHSKLILAPKREL